MAKTAQYETYTEAEEQMITDGWVRDNYDPLYPYVIAWNDRDGMRARIVFDDYRQAYIVEGIHI